MDSATLTKFLDFVSFDVRHVPGSKKNFEKFQNITRCQRGDPSKTETRAESAPPQPTTSFQNPAQIGLIINHATKQSLRSAICYIALKKFFWDFSGTCLTLKETKSRNLVSVAQSTWTRQTIFGDPGRKCPPQSR